MILPRKINFTQMGCYSDSSASDNIWMSITELMHLFGIIYSRLSANIKAIYKSGILNECEAQRYTDVSNGISIDVYALPMIIALSFRLNILGAYKMREYIINNLQQIQETRFKPTKREFL